MRAALVLCRVTWGLIAGLALPCWAVADTTFEVRVAGNSYDAEQDSGGRIQLNNSKLELGVKTWVGFNFQNVNVPQGAPITAAYVQFKAADNNTETTHLTIFGEDVNSAAVFSSSSNNLSNRARTSASVTWNNVASWTNDELYDSPDTSAIVQEIVDRNNSPRPEWSTHFSATIHNALRLAIAYTHESTLTGAPASLPSLDIFEIEQGSFVEIYQAIQQSELLLPGSSHNAS